MVKPRRTALPAASDQSPQRDKKPKSSATSPCSPSPRKSHTRSAAAKPSHSAKAPSNISSKKATPPGANAEPIQVPTSSEGENLLPTTGRKRKRESQPAKKIISKQNSPTSSSIKQKKGLLEEGAPNSEADAQSPDKTIKALKTKSPKKQGPEEGETDPVSVKRRRKTKEEKEAEAMPLVERTQGLRMFIGAHVSCAKGVHNSIINSSHIGGNAFAMFLKSQRKWENPPLNDEVKEQFKAGCIDAGYDAMRYVLPHGSYLVNLAQAEAEKAAQAFAGFIDDLHRCDALGIKYYNFHPGNTGSHPRPAAISRIASALNRAHKVTRTVVPLLETMATAGSNSIGSSFEDLRDIIAEVDDKNRIGVCLDTCHVFAAGYDLRQPKEFGQTLQQFDEIIGMHYLKALHLNDSKAPLGAGRDLHQNIGLGFLGLRAFHSVVNESRFEGLPLILETPIDRKDENGKDVEDKNVWAREIKMLESLIGMDANSKEFKDMERHLAAEGAQEREKYQEAFQRKKAKLERGQTKLSFGKGSKKKAESNDSANEA